MTVYLDIIFLENLCINCIILLATALINKNSVSILRILLSSLIGSIYAVLVYLPSFPMLTNVLMKILLSISMVHIAYNTKSIKTLLKQLIIFYLTSFTFGGVAFALLYFIKPDKILIKNGVLIGTYPIKIILTGVILGFVIITFSFKNHKKKLSRKDMFCNITLNFENKVQKITALIDTGNLLKEPITGNSVVVVEKEKLVEIIPEEILNNIQKIIIGDIDINLNKYASKFKIIPFSSLGKENGLLLGIKIDSVEIEYDDQESNVKDIVVGIYDKKFSRNGTYSALVGLDIINKKEEEKHEYITNIKE